MKIWTKLCLALVISGASIAKADDLAPLNIVNVTSADRTATIDAWCSTRVQDPGRLFCKFERMNFRLPNVSEVFKERDFVLKELKTKDNGNLYGKNWCMELSKSRWQPTNGDNSELGNKIGERWKAICTSNVKSAAELSEKMFQELYEQQAATCTIAVETYEDEFTLRGSVWVSNLVETMCARQITTLERDKTQPDYAPWTIRVTAIRAKDREVGLCEGKLPDAEIHYKASNHGIIPLDRCKYLNMGN